MEERPPPPTRVAASAAARFGRHPRLGLFLILFAGFTLHARLFGRLHPLNPMSMFADSPTSGSHIAVRMPDGELREVWWFERWSCDHAIAFDEDGQLRGSDQIHRNYILAVVGEPRAGIPIEVIRRTYRFQDAGAAVAIEDQTLFRCRADLKQAPTKW